jgi:predicted  nucleic acid-binding Zn-ribbon protein
MTNTEQLKSNTVERLNTRIDMIREESRTLSHRIAILEERRKELKDTLRIYSLK